MDTMNRVVQRVGRAAPILRAGGFLTVSFISNVIRYAGAGDPVTYESGPPFVRNVQCSNLLTVRE